MTILAPLPGCKLCVAHKFTMPTFNMVQKKKNMPSEIRRWLHKGTVELVRKFVLIWILKILLKW